MIRQRVVSILILPLAYVVTLRACGTLVFLAYGKDVVLQRSYWTVDWTAISIVLIGFLLAAALCTAGAAILRKSYTPLELLWCGVAAAIINTLYAAVVKGPYIFELMQLYPVHNLVTHLLMIIALPTVYIGLRQVWRPHGNRSDA